MADDDEQNPWRRDFPILENSIKGKPLVYLDNAATTQKPQAVLDRVSGFLARENANIHRGVYYLSMSATDAYDRARETVAKFINARSAREIVFVRGTTEGVNLVAGSLSRCAAGCGAGIGGLGEGDEILVTIMEHHANFVPWQRLAEEKGAVLKVAPITDRGEIDLDEFEKLIGERTRFVAFTHVSNALGTVNPVAAMTKMARDRGIPVLIDGAQAVPHVAVDVRDIGCDFYAFSGHKLFGPDGIGVLYGREELLNALPPYQVGGDMIESVSVERTTFRNAPERFEAGTPNISGAIGLAAAIDYLGQRDSTGGFSSNWKEIQAHESMLMEYATKKVGAIPGVRLVGTAREKVGVISFVLDEAHPHDVGTVLDVEGVCVRAGHHCAMPLMKRLGVAGTARASFSFYNTRADVDRLVAALRKVKALFARAGCAGVNR